MTPQPNKIILPQSILENLAQANIVVNAAQQVTGGDINEARKITTADDREFFLKFNNHKEGQFILESEFNGLELLRKNDLPSPSIIHYSLSAETPYLLFEWIDESQRNDQQLAEVLKDLHSVTNKNYGLDSSNHIGSLPQPNTWSSDFYEFYIEHRIEAQLRMARENGFNFKVKLEQLDRILRNTIPEEQPALIHGDLWAGNMMDGPKGPIFIDPSISFCHREMDLAMMLLFGGYSEAVFQHYEEIFPLENNWQQRKDLFQLYYLLVHVNLFGTSYYDAVQNIILKRYLS